MSSDNNKCIRLIGGDSLIFKAPADEAAALVNKDGTHEFVSRVEWKHQKWSGIAAMETNAVKQAQALEKARKFKEMF